MSDDQTPPDARQRRRARRAAKAYRATRRMAAKAVPARPRRLPGKAGRPAASPKRPARREEAADPAPGPAETAYRARPVRTGLLFGFGFAAGSALFRLILILIFYGLLAALGFWLYSHLIGGF
jgi:hypothetical protein